MADWTSRTGDARILHGSCLERLRDLPDGSVQCCVTSPPYWGLRDYGHADQLGLEPTPEAYVANMVEVFREVRRVLRDDGTLWLNLGDSYAANRSYQVPSTKGGPKHSDSQAAGGKASSVPDGLKPKDLIGIPWSVAKALQAPFYAGRIKSELDRVWLAATIDAEGSICGFTHERKDDGTIRTGIHLTITNTNKPLLDNAFRIWPTSREEHNFHGEGHLGSADTYRWIAHNVDDKAALLREIYPYLVAKKKQALLAWNFLEMSRDAKRLARTREADSIKEKRAWIVSALSRLNHFEDVDTPSWCVEPPSLYEHGYYLRQDIIWHKPNPMPESVTDRCTKAHEYIFLLAKSARYYYDSEAVKEASVDPESLRHEGRNKRNGDKFRNHDGDGFARTRVGFEKLEGVCYPTRNRRSVWTVSTKPYSGAHFATYPPDLIEPCILAGTSERGRCKACGAAWERVVERIQQKRYEYEAIGIPGESSQRGRRTESCGTSSYTSIGWQPTCRCNAGDPIPCVVLDPFNGSGTTGEVCIKHGRHYVGCELNQDYIGLAIDRLRKADERHGAPLWDAKAGD